MSLGSRLKMKLSGDNYLSQTLGRRLRTKLAVNTGFSRPTTVSSAPTNPNAASEMFNGTKLPGSGFVSNGTYMADPTKRISESDLAANPNSAGYKPSTTGGAGEWVAGYKPPVQPAPSASNNYNNFTQVPHNADGSIGSQGVPTYDGGYITGKASTPYVAQKPSLGGNTNTTGGFTNWPTTHNMYQNTYGGGPTQGAVHGTSASGYAPGTTRIGGKDMTGAKPAEIAAAYQKSQSSGGGGRVTASKLRPSNFNNADFGGGKFFNLNTRGTDYAPGGRNAGRAGGPQEVIDAGGKIVGSTATVDMSQKNPDGTPKFKVLNTVGTVDESQQNRPPAWHAPDSVSRARILTSPEYLKLKNENLEASRDWLLQRGINFETVNEFP